MTTEQMVWWFFSHSTLFLTDLQLPIAVSSTLFLNMDYRKNKYIVQYGLNCDFSFIREQISILED